MKTRGFRQDRGRNRCIFGAGEGRSLGRMLGLKQGISFPGTDVKPGELHAPVCHTPVPDMVHDHVPGFVQHPVNDPGSITRESARG